MTHTPPACPPESLPRSGRAQAGKLPESWKFTPLPRAVEELRCTPLCTTLGCLEAALPVVSGPHAVFHNGELASPLSQPLSLAPNVQLETLPPLSPQRNRIPNTQYPIPEIPSPFTLHPSPYSLTVKGPTTQPLHLIHAMSGPPSTTRIGITLEDNAELTLVEHHVAAPRFESWQQVEVIIRLGRGAKLTHTVLQTLPPRCLLTRVCAVEVAEGASCHTSQFQLGGKLSRLETHTTMAAGAEFTHTALNLTRHRQLHDTTLVTTFKGEANHTNIRSRSLVEDSGRAVFQGKFHVQPEAQKTDAYMHSHALLLGENARADHKPELEIYADDVTCSHGAATGGLDADQLFYLAARGFPAAQARALLVAGYAEEFIALFPEAHRATLARYLEKWLAEPPHRPTEGEDFQPIEGEWLKHRNPTPHKKENHPQDDDEEGPQPDE